MSGDYISIKAGGEWSIQAPPPPTEGIRRGTQFLEGPISPDLHLPHRHVWTATWSREPGFKLTHYDTLRSNGFWATNGQQIEGGVFDVFPVASVDLGRFLGVPFTGHLGYPWLSEYIEGYLWWIIRQTAVIAVVVAACTTQVEVPPPSDQILEVTDVGTFNEPVQLVDHVSGMWVVERGGRVVSFDGEVLVDLEIDISEGSIESGLLGLEFGDDRYWLYVANPEDGTSGLYEIESEIESLDEAKLIRGWGEAPFHFGGHMELHGEWLYIGVGDGASGPDDLRAYDAQLREPDRGAILRWRTGTDEWECY